MSLERVFRGLVVCDIVITITAVTASFVGERFLPPALLAYVQAKSEAPMTLLEVILAAVGLPLMVILVLAWVGLLRWWKVAPHLYLGVCGGSAVFLLFTGPTVETAFDSAIDTAGNMLSGLILGISYFSSLRGRFRGQTQSGAASAA